MRNKILQTLLLTTALAVSTVAQAMENPDESPAGAGGVAVRHLAPLSMAKWKISVEVGEEGSVTCVTWPRPDLGLNSAKMIFYGGTKLPANEIATPMSMLHLVRMGPSASAAEKETAKRAQDFLKQYTLPDEANPDTAD